MKYFLTTISFFLFLSLASSQDTSMKIDNKAFTVQQAQEINLLLNTTKTHLPVKLNTISDEEEFSKSLMMSSYKFAKEIAKILDLDNLPFNVIIGSTNFLGEWNRVGFDTNAACIEKLVDNILPKAIAKLD